MENFIVFQIYLDLSKIHLIFLENYFYIYIYLFLIYIYTKMYFNKRKYIEK